MLAAPGCGACRLDPFPLDVNDAAARGPYALGLSPAHRATDLVFPSGGHGKMEADHWRLQIKQELKPPLIKKKRQWITSIWQATEAELVIVVDGSGTLACDELRPLQCADGMGEEIQVKWSVSGSTYLIGVVPRSLRRQCNTPRAKRAGV